MIDIKLRNVKVEDAHRETARALEVILSRLKFDPQTTRILKIHLTTQRSLIDTSRRSVDK